MRRVILALACTFCLAAPQLYSAADNCAEEAIACPAEILLVGNPVHTIHECRNNVPGVLPQASNLNPSKGTEVLRRGCNWQYRNGIRGGAPCNNTLSTHSVPCGEL